MEYIKITKCPECGSKHLRISELEAQLWRERTVTNKGVTKGRLKRYLEGETYSILSCADCNFMVDCYGDFKIDSDDNLLLSDKYFDEKEAEKIRKEQEEKTRKATEELIKRGLL